MAEHLEEVVRAERPLVAEVAAVFKRTEARVAEWVKAHARGRE